MFNMIGGDGREYGPVTADQLREWILDHRADGGTRVRREGAADWSPLAELPEFGEALATAARLHPLPPPLPATPATTVPAEELPAGGDFQVMACLSRGWALLQQNFLLIVGACGFVWCAQTLPGGLGVVGALLGLLISGALYGGLFLLVLQLVRGQPAGFGDLFACFNAKFLACTLVWLVTGIGSEIGLALLLLPGIFLKVIWAFSLPLTADRGCGLRGALTLSWRLATPRFFKVLGLLMLAYLPVIVFAGYSFVMMFARGLENITSPVSLFSPEFWERVQEMSRYAAHLAFQQHLVLLLNLPFAVPAVAAAYEELIAGRRAPAA